MSNEKIIDLPPPPTPTPPLAAHDSYADAEGDIYAMIDMFPPALRVNRERLEKLQATWTMVGNICHARNLLREALAMLSGQDESEIEDGLSLMRKDESC